MPALENSILSPVSLTSYFDDASGAVKHANLYFYKAGTLDMISVYQDPLLGIAHAQPVLTTGFGRVPPVYVGELRDPDTGLQTGYRVRAFDQYSQLLEDLDNLPGAVIPEDAGEVEEPLDTNQLIKTGDIIPAWSNAQPRTGFVRCNGGTIGPASAGISATERANNDTHALFVHLWGQDASALLPVLPSRGTSAEGDWLAGNKVISTPDLRGRAIIGTDPMVPSGGTITGRMTGAVLTAGVPNAGVIGASGGVATQVLDLTQLPSHNHGGATGTDSPDHTHGGVTGPQNANHYHNVNGITDNQGAHAHLYDRYSASGANTQQAGSNQARNPVATWTDTQGTHYHNMNFDSGLENAVHAHGFTTYGANARHAHAVSAEGGGLAHNNAQPFIALAFYIKL